MVINGNQSAATGAVTVQSTGTLAGSGTVGGSTTISGVHSPGNSPGLQNFSTTLDYASGATLQWELVGNTTAGRGSNFDGINVGTHLNFATGLSANLVFNAAGSGVNWADGFWNTAQTWLVYDANGTTTAASLAIFDSINLSVDSLGQSLATARSGWEFSFSQTGNDIYLNYSAIPEPSSVLLLLTGGLMALVFRRKRRLV